MPIWFNPSFCLDDIKNLGAKTMGDHLGMEWIEVGPDYLKIRMPVAEQTKQPYGLLHGGASVALAETAGSVASHFVVDNEKFMSVGLEINANHLRGVRNGFVTAICTPVHIGASTHVWDIKIHDDLEQLVCISRLTVAILKKNLNP